MDLLALEPADISEAIGVGKSTVYRYLSGKIEPSYSVMLAFSKAYYVNIDWLATGAGEPFRSRDKMRKAEALRILKEVSVLCVEHDTTYKEIAKVVGLPEKYFSDLKKGRITMPREKLTAIRAYYANKRPVI
jgi:hypothetical protein